MLQLSNIKQEPQSPSKSATIVQIYHNVQFDEVSKVKQECEIHIIDFAKSSNLHPQIYDEYPFDRIKAEPELEIIDELQPIPPRKRKKYRTKPKKPPPYDPDRVPCAHCDGTFKNNIGLRSHMAHKHKNIKCQPATFTCDTCGRSFNRKSKLLNHMRRHAMHVNCSVCQKSLLPACVYLHMREFHGDNAKFKCPLCEQIYNSETKFKQHVKIHIKKYECEFCGRKFSQSYRYTQHIMWHKDSNAFLCKVCGKTFMRRASLNEHTKIHNKDKVKTHDCTKCDFKTIYVKQLRFHLEKHKRYELREQRLMKLSTASRCDICSAIFKHRKAVIGHKHLVHPKRMVTCDLCGYQFKSKDALRRHVCRMHLRLKVY